MKFIKVMIKKIICFFRGVKSGYNTFISPKVEIVNSKNITLGNNVVVEKYSRLIANGKSAEISVGDNTYIQSYVLLKTNGGKIKIGKDCTINDYSVLYGHGGLIIGNDVHISTHVIIVPMNHIYKNPHIPISKQGEIRKGIVIEDDVWIGANAVILDGVQIGKGTVVGAGAVVTKSIPPFSVVGGVPAKVIKKRE